MVFCRLLLHPLWLLLSLLMILNISGCDGSVPTETKSTRGEHADATGVVPEDSGTGAADASDLDGTRPVPGDTDPVFDHSQLTSDCAKCHESARPKAVDGFIHGDGRSCEQCHRYDPAKKWQALTGSFSHDPMPQSCAGCHQETRPPLPHVSGGDCAQCHSFPDWKVVKLDAYKHEPKPEACVGCHLRPTQVGNRAYPNQGPPAGFDQNNSNELGSAHYVGKDCGSCHLTPPEGATEWEFTHSKPNPAVCLPCHYNSGRREHNGENGVTLIGFGNCASCHNNFDRSTGRNWRPK